MNKTEFKNYFIQLHQSINCQLFGRKFYSFKITERQDKMMETFLKLLHQQFNLNTLKESFIEDYLVYQFYIWHDKTHLLHNKKAVAFNVIFGKKGIERWNNKNEETGHYYSYEKIVRELGIDLKKNIPVKKKKSPYLFPSKLEETYKINDLLGENRLANCFVKTTLFNHRSKHCIVCREKQDCKLLLKENYPNIYKIRGYIEPR